MNVNSDVFGSWGLEFFIYLVYLFRWGLLDYRIVYESRKRMRWGGTSVSLVASVYIWR